MVVEARENVQYEEFYGTAIQKLTNLIMAFYGLNKAPLANEISRNLTTIAVKVVAENHYQKEFILGEILNQYRIIFPISMKLAQGAFFTTIDTYSITGRPSILSIVEMILNRYRNDLDKSATDADGHRTRVFHVGDLSNNLSKIFDHFRELGSSVTFSDDMSLWNIIATIKHTGELLFALRADKKVPAPDIKTTDALIHRCSVLPGWLFTETKPFTIKNATDAADAIASIGLLAMKNEIQSVPDSCVRTIQSISKSVCSTSKSL